MKKTLTIIGLALAAVVAVAQDKPAPPAAQSTAAPVASQPSGDPIVIAAGDVTIRQSEFETALKTLPAEYQQFASGPGKKRFAEDYLRMKMLAAEGTRNGLDKDPEVLQSLNLMRENLVANAQLSRIEKNVVVTDADLQKVFDSNKKDYEQVKARHILIAFKGSPAAQSGKKEISEPEAKAKAESIKKQLEGGAKFEDVAKKESDDVASGARGGELGTFGHGQMVEEFEKAAFAAKAGDVVGPVRTQFGYHIIKVDSHEYQPFAEVKAALEKQERQKKVQATLDAMKTSANPTFNEAYFTPPAPPKPAMPMNMDAPPQPASSPSSSKPVTKPASNKKPAPKKP